MRRSISLLIISIFTLYFGGLACSGGGDNACDPVAQTGCDAGQVCEQVTDGTTACFAPVTMLGTVTDAVTGQPIAGARVVALDANGSAASNVAITDINGNYELQVFSTRDASGDPVSTVFLRADAAGYQSFPGLQPPFPVDLSSALPDGDGFLLDSALTDIHLVALDPIAPDGSIEGNVQLPPDRLSVLVVAELENGATCPAQLFGNDCTAIAGEDGAFKIFNLPAGTYVVKAYVQGSNYNSVTINLADGQAGVAGTLAVNGDATASFTGKINIVNPGIGNATSVVLVVNSTLLQINSEVPGLTNLPIVIRGPVPPGLRVADVTGEFTLEGIPAGTYAVLAAFENDNLVRDPDPCIAGTDILFQTFTAGQVVDVSNNPFKVTGALDNPTPTNNALTTSNPTFTWDDDSGEDNYLISVINSFGVIMGEAFLPGQNGGPTVSAVYDIDVGGLTLTPGFYQFHVYSIDPPTGGCPDSNALSQTEDFLGTFEVQ
jgi:uncharacterized protein (DUF2141 family)